VADTRKLPAPVTETWDWQMEAACRGMDSSLFFHPEHERGSARAAREAQAKQICNRCPVLEPCRRHALATQEPYGIWGGLTESERERILRTHRRRPAVNGAPTTRSRPQHPTGTARRRA
jgi:WhiB family redox-sensing transcriptional regulator